MGAEAVDVVGEADVPVDGAGWRRVGALTSGATPCGVAAVAAVSVDGWATGAATFAAAAGGSPEGSVALTMRSDSPDS